MRRLTWRTAGEKRSHGAHDENTPSLTLPVLPSLTLPARMLIGSSVSEPEASATALLFSFISLHFDSLHRLLNMAGAG